MTILFLLAVLLPHDIEDELKVLGFHGVFYSHFGLGGHHKKIQ